MINTINSSLKFYFYKSDLKNIYMNNINVTYVWNTGLDKAIEWKYNFLYGIYILYIHDIRTRT